MSKLKEFKNQNWYKILYHIATVALPAFAVFYFTCSDIWGLPFGQEIFDTLTAVAVLIATLIGAVETSSFFGRRKERKNGKQNRH